MRNIKAFTLIELLVVISIIGILAGLSIFGLDSYFQTARDTQRKSDLKQYQTALETYANKNNGLYPSYTGGVVTTDFLCESLYPTENPPCPAPGDVMTGQVNCSGATCNYRYESNGSDGGSVTGSLFVLSAPLESSGDATNTHFAVCSTGKSGLTTAALLANTNGVCPI